MMVFDRVVAVADRLTWQSWAATLCFAVFTQVLSHPNHTSLAEIEFNTKTGRFEVSLCVWPEDLEKALEKMVEETLKLNEDNVKEHVPKYLRNNFKLVGADSSAWTIRWVGAEIDVKKTWLYFEMVPASKADVFKKLMYSNKLTYSNLRTVCSWSLTMIKSTT